MNIDNYWFLLLAVAVSVAAGVAFALKSRRRHHRASHDLEHKTDLRSWENEGGNLSPSPVPPVLP